MALNAALARATISAGIPAGPTRPYQSEAVAPGTASAIVGTPGMAASGAGVLTATGRTPPDCRKGAPT
jgi:hypothetical protein